MSQKHKFGISGRTILPDINKRKPTSNLGSNSKKVRSDNNISLEATEFDNEGFENENNTELSESEDLHTSNYASNYASSPKINDELTHGNIVFINNFIKALEDDRVKALLAESVSKHIATVERQVKNMEKDIMAKNKAIADLEYRIEELEQENRKNNIIISGFNNKDIATTKSELNSALKSEIRNEDIDAVIPLPDLSGKKRAIIKFKSHELKMGVMKNKPNLRGTNQSINDHLTKERANIAYLCRKAVKEKKLSQTWVYDSQIFVKSKMDSKPKKVLVKDDLPFV
jgi:hypothetical protein